MAKQRYANPGHYSKGARRLRRYWAGKPTKHGKREHDIMWGTPGDWSRCVARVSKYLGPGAKGYCNLAHHRATGFWPGHAPAERAAHRRHHR
jgi:hypothetical protein